MRREMRRHYYGPHQRYRLWLIRVVHNRCARCRQMLPSSKLTLAHLSHDPKDYQHVAVFCFSCHGSYDAKHSHAMRRRTLARRIGQLWLWPEVEWDPFPAWETPLRVIEARQSSIFES